MKNWHKYEVKDANRDYWTIFFRLTNLDEAKKNTRLGSEGYWDVEWSYYIFFGCTEKMAKLSDHDVDEITDARGLYHGVFEWELDVTKLGDICEPSERDIALGAPGPEKFLRHYQEQVLGALMCACQGNLIENSLEPK